jgi:hypothetical protein
MPDRSGRDTHERGTVEHGGDRLGIDDGGGLDVVAPPVADQLASRSARQQPTAQVVPGVVEGRRQAPTPGQSANDRPVMRS